MQAHMRHAARSAPLATHQLRSYAHAAARQRRGHPRRDPLGRFAPAGGSQDTSVCYVLSSGRTERSTSQPSVSSAPIVLGADDKVYTLFEFDTQEPVSVVGELLGAS